MGVVRHRRHIGRSLFRIAQVGRFRTRVKTGIARDWIAEGHSRVEGADVDGLPPPPDNPVTATRSGSASSKASNTSRPRFMAR